MYLRRRGNEFSVVSYQALNNTRQLATMGTWAVFTMREVVVVEKDEAVASDSSGWAIAGAPENKLLHVGCRRVLPNTPSSVALADLEVRVSVTYMHSFASC